MFSCYTELFEIELIICIKMDLTLNNLQRLIYHKTQPTNQPLLLFYYRERLWYWYIKYIQLLFFLFITQNVWMSKVHRVKDGCTHRDWGMNNQCAVFLFLLSRLKSSWLYNIPDVNANLHGHTSFSLTHCMWTWPLLACHPDNFYIISAENTSILFTLVAGCISCYFHLTKVCINRW